MARAVSERRTALGLTRADVQMRSRAGGNKGLSQEAIRAIERGERDNVHAATARGLERALDWPAGYVDRVMDGTGEPLDGPIPEPAQPNVVAGLFEFLTDDQRRQLLQAARAWVQDNPAYRDDLGLDGLLAGEDLTDDERTEVRALVEQVVRLGRRRAG